MMESRLQRISFAGSSDPQWLAGCSRIGYPEGLSALGLVLTGEQKVISKSRIRSGYT